MRDPKRPPPPRGRGHRCGELRYCVASSASSEWRVVHCALNMKEDKLCVK